MEKKGLFIFHLIGLFLIIENVKSFNVHTNHVRSYPLLMPNVTPYKPELYLCTPVKINTTVSRYIIGFKPNATMNVAHHMLIYGCEEPGRAEGLWNCGEMAAKGDDVLKSAPPCKSGSQIIYAWARDAPDLSLPKGVGFKVGKDSPVKYLVLQVHYAHILSSKTKTDDSGVFLHYTNRRLDKLAGVYLLATAGQIQAKSIEFMEASCPLFEDKVMYPFAYRTHTHSLGKVVAGYVIKNGRWIELGKRNPLTPQMFYPVHNNVTIEKGDILAARCTMDNYRNRTTLIGFTNEDEMCNFYLMYYVDHDQPLEQKFCVSPGPPGYYWQSDGLPNIPYQEASLL